MLQCYANGICAGMAYCHPIPVAHPMVCHCAPSYGCGQYGCYKLRARASKNMKLSLLDNGQQWSTSLQIPFDKKSHEPPMLIPLHQLKFGYIPDNFFFFLIHAICKTCKVIISLRKLD